MNPERYAEIKKLFLAATELEESARVQFLRDRCGEDKQLRREVESLLACHSPRTILPAGPSEKHEQSETQFDQAKTTLRDRARVHSSRPSIPRLGPKGQLALGAAIVAVLLVLFGWWQSVAVQQSIKKTLRSRMSALLEGHVESFEHWANFQRKNVEYWAQDPEFQLHVERLISLEESGSGDFADKLRGAPEQIAIRHELRSAGGDETEYVILDLKQRIIAEGPDKGSGLGQLASSESIAKLASVFRGETIMFVDKILDIVHPDYPMGLNTTDVFVAAPVRDANKKIIAVVAMFNVDTALMENTIRSMSSITETSETYAFDAVGVMLSESRFNEDLRRVGMLDSDESSRSSLNVMLRDPGGDLTAGYKPTASLASRPLTRMARYAIAGESGSDLDGYRNYLGRKVVGVWTWLPEYEFGFALEMSYEEAYRSLRFVERQFILSFVLLTASAIGILLSAFWISSLRRQAGKKRQLGQYTLEKQIGEGGMGQVFEAKHALLKRPCTVKLLKPDQSNPRSLAWFEREVQEASQLVHPNTIQIFDYGTTPEGNFFYVMEYLHGIDLEQLVVREGPIPWPRVVFIMKQICLSLREAHESGVVHRDIKPQNIMICQLGGETDFVKVLDFGLAKKIDPDAATQTRTGFLAGTPLYMAPERWRGDSKIDARSDIYSLGAVAYRLLAAEDICRASSPIELVEQILAGDVTPLSELGVTDLPPALESLVMSCLAKDISSRPDSVDRILEQLQALPDDQQWDSTTAREWWKMWKESTNTSSATHS